MKKLEKVNERVQSVEISGDGESWEPLKSTSFAQDGGGMANIIELILNHDRVFLRTKYLDVYNNGTLGLPKTGAVYELQLLEIQPLRQLIEATAKVAELPAGAPPEQSK